MMFKITAVLLIVINAIVCQEFNSSLADSPSVINVTEDDATSIKSADANLSPSGLPPREIADKDQHQTEPPLMQEQADQPAQTEPPHPTRIPATNPEVSTFPPLVHQNISTENVKSENKTTVVTEAPPPATTKSASEAAKPTMAPVETKKPEVKPGTTTTAPGNKDVKKGDASFARENVVLIILSACVFRYLN